MTVKVELENMDVFPGLDELVPAPHVAPMHDPNGGGTDLGGDAHGRAQAFQARKLHAYQETTVRAQDEVDIAREAFNDDPTSRDRRTMLRLAKRELERSKKCLKVRRVPTEVILYDRQESRSIIVTLMRPYAHRNPSHYRILTHPRRPRRPLSMNS